MNHQIRRLLILSIIMFTALFIATTWVQFFNASTLNADGRNVRTVYRQYGQERGQILVGDTTIARSVPVDDNFKYLRQYPAGPLYAHLTGYFPTGLQGMATGLERVKGEVLTGAAPSLWVQRLQDLVTGRQPHGGSIRLTIDPKLQQVAAQGLGNRHGAVVVLNPKTGQILAQYSSPSFDPNPLSSHNRTTAISAFEKLNQDQAHPLVDRTIAGDLYPPGSIFKLITTSAMINNENTKASTILEAPTTMALPQTNKQLGNYGGASCGSGRVELSYAIAKSCNTPFAQAALRLGASKIAEEAQKYGFGENFSTPLPVTPSVFPPPADPPILAYQSIGQGSVRVTPMQIALMVSAIANRGQVMKPYLIDQELSPQLEVTKQYAPSTFSQPLDAEKARELAVSMERTVNEGTATGVAIDGVKIAAKTGTAEEATGGPTTWFAGYAPVNDPQITVVVVIDGGAQARLTDTGSELAVPIARQIFLAGLKP